MTRYSLSVAQDHVLSLTAVRQPIVAIEQLIWNALDEDATEVTVELVINRLLGLDTIRIKDNGNGLRHDKCADAFGKIGGSPKLFTRTTPKGRVPHGKLGRGRLKAFGIGKSVTWTSCYRDNGDCYEFRIKCLRATIKDFEVSDPKLSKSTSTGVTVEITDIQENFPSLLDTLKAEQELSRRLALYLRKYPNISIRYDGVTLDPSAMEERVATYPLEVPLPSGPANAELTVIEWRHAVDRALYLCDEHGFAIDEKPPGIQAKGFYFTAYLKSSIIPTLAESAAIDLGELDPSVKSLLDCGRDALRTHFRKREATRLPDLVQRWQKEQVYPYDKLAADPVETAEREVFDICAVKVHEYLPNFDNFDSASKRLTFRLIREALASNPTALQKILRDVVAMPQEQQAELASLLERTSLGAIINAAKVVMDRLDFLGGLHPLLFGQYKNTLLETQQLHQILSQELWIFGERYAIGVDEGSLKTLLKEHINILERDDLIGKDETVTDLVEQKERRVDLMLYCRYPQSIPDSYEHLVVELKRPGKPLGQKEINQIENYAFTVSNDDRFNKKNVRWTFVLLGNGLNTFAENKCNVKDREFGHIYSGDIDIFVKSWATVIDEAKWRYEFFRDKLNHQVSTEGAIEFLRNKHGDHLPDDTADAK